MLNDIVSILDRNGIKDYVYTTSLSSEFNGINSDIHKSCFDDIRSATFFALGKAIKKNKIIALFIPGEYITNVYTGITEAWFQKANVLVIAMYNNYYDVKCDYMDRCLMRKATFYSKDLDKINNEIISMCNFEINGPALLNVISSQLNGDSNSVNAYSSILNCFKDVLEKDSEVFCYNINKDELGKYQFKINNISSKYKYGIISKYMGYVNGLDKKVVLCCTSDCILLDSNIFNNRYINEHIKIVIIDKDEIITRKNIDSWINSNNVKCFYEEECNVENMKKFYTTEEPAILILKEGVK